MAAPTTGQPLGLAGATPSGRSDRAAFTVTDWGLLAGVGLIWGSSYLLIKVGLEAFHPGLITWARVALGALALAVCSRTRVPIEAGDRRRMTWLSVLWVAVPFTLFPLAEQQISSALTGLLTGATPLFTGLIGGLWFARAPRGAQRLGIAVGFVGVALVSVTSGHDGSNGTLGAAMVLVATACYGFATNLAGPLQQRYGSVVVMGRMLALATVWTAPLGVIGVTRSHLALGPTVAVAVLGIVGTGLAFVLMASLVGRVGGPRASLATYLIPLVALGLGAAFLDERVAPLALAGTALVLLGAGLGSRTER